MKKLSDVVIQKRVKVMQTDTRGVAHQVTREIKKKLVVKTTGQGLRIVHLLVDYYGLIFLLFFQLVYLALQEHLLSYYFL